MVNDKIEDKELIGDEMGASTGPREATDEEVAAFEADKKPLKKSPTKAPVKTAAKASSKKSMDKAKSAKGLKQDEKSAPKIAKPKKTAEAKLKSVKISPIKLKMVTRPLRGMPVEKAIMVLTFSKKGITNEVKKVLKSAMANAENNHGMDIDDLIIDRVDVGKSMVLRRFRARAKGRGNRILKPFSSMRIVLIEKGE